jgi:hypothetical protein
MSLALHGGLLDTDTSSGNRDADERGNLLNGITPRERRVTSSAAANPQTTLTCGLLCTSAGAAGAVPVPGEIR